MSFTEFISMSGYGEFVWSAYGFGLLVLVINVASAVRRLRKSRKLDHSVDQGE